MTIWRNGTISRNLAVLLIMALLPVLALLLYNSFEQRRQAIAMARDKATVLSSSMAEVQHDLTRSSRQLLATLSLIPSVQKQDIAVAGHLFATVIQQHSDYQNITLTALDGTVLAAALPFSHINLADRRHVREAIDNNRFAVGEFIIARVGDAVPALAFAYPVRDQRGQPAALLTASVRLTRFADFQRHVGLPESSFFTVTDHRGVILYHSRENGNELIGQPLDADIWEAAVSMPEGGLVTRNGSDSTNFIIAHHPVIVDGQQTPYAYMWVGIPAAQILKPANSMLIHNLIAMAVIVGLALLITWKFGRATLIKPITGLARATRSFADGNLPQPTSPELAPKEISSLSTAFFDMATTIEANQTTLANSEARFRLIMDSIDALVYVADMDTYELLFINQYGKERLGGVIGHTCWKAIQKDQSGPCPFCTNHRLVDASGQPTGLITWEFRNTRTERWYYIQDRAITWVDGRLVRLEIATDITEKKEAEAALAREKERLAVTLDSIGDGVITTDTEGRVVMLNPIAENLTGWRSDEACGKPLDEVFVIINEHTRQICDNPVTKVLESKQIVGLANHTALIARDGTERSIADSGAPIITPDGDIIGVVLVFRDVTEQLQLEKELDRAKKIESLGTLAGGIAHDFNNMLTAILGNLELSLHDQQLPEKSRKRLGNAVKAALRARDLTRQLLTFAKGGQPIRQTAALPDVIRDSAEFILHGGAVACRYQFADDLLLADIDKNQISQVIQNLVLNAVQAMPQGGFIDISCDNVSTEEAQRLNLDGEQTYIKLQVRDHGTGIPAKLIDKIFDPYFSTKSEGHGLGLAIVHSIINRHDGQIRVSSSAGEGTLFSIYLPAASATARPAPKKRLFTTDKQRLRLLIMDDEQPVLDTVCQMVEDLGHECIQALDGDQALQLYREQRNRQQPVDLVVMDLTIPGGRGGKDTIKDLLQVDPQAKAIVASGYSQDPIMANYRQHGFCATLPKPYSFDELAAVIAAAAAKQPSGPSRPV